MLVKLFSVVLSTLFLWSTSSNAQIPNKTIRLIVPFSPGGGADSMARPLSDQLKNKLDRTVVIENKPGAASNIGTEFVARSTPDGSTLLINTDGIAIYPYLYSKLNYNIFKDLIPITFIAETPLVLASNKSLSPNNLKELIAFAKVEDNNFSFANPGLGTPHHLAFELFAKQAGINAAQPVYKGGGPALQDVLAGHTQVGMFTLGAVIGHINQGNLKPYAVMTEKRANSADNIPTMSEAGLPGVRAGLRFVLMAPKGTPPQTISAIYKATIESLKEPALREAYSKQGFEILGTTPEETEKMMRQDYVKWGPILNQLNIKLD
jgi:tripartite-type tricarboxylate transporter receptor subunit TctC